MDDKRAGRLKAALRENLKRRKASGRAEPREKKGTTAEDRPKADPHGSKPGEG